MGGEASISYIPITHSNSFKCGKIISKILSKILPPPPPPPKKLKVVEAEKLECGIMVVELDYGFCVPDGT
jgi:hypothetical protein